MFLALETGDDHLFDQALLDLNGTEPLPDDIWSIFYASDDYLHEQYGVLHFLEAQSAEAYYMSLAKNIVKLKFLSGNWTKNIILRIANAGNHEINVFSKVVTEACEPEEALIIDALIVDLVQGPKNV
ncbi:Imm30 family immunity protein [Sulfurovum sp.]|uniref:Imm30 family immunity protein n=1 Tax=Sulfurovum sp. TaxID=1969726 RepID=UPI003568B19B